MKIFKNIFRPYVNAFDSLDEYSQHIYDDMLLMKKFLHATTPIEVAAALAYRGDVALPNLAKYRTQPGGGCMPRLYAKASRIIEKVEERIQIVVPSAEFKVQCLVEMGALSTPSAGDDDIVMFDYVAALPGAAPCVAYYVPTPVVAQAGNRVLVKSPRWVYRVMYTNLSALANAGSFEISSVIGPLCSPPDADMLADALSLWCDPVCELYKCFSDALVAVKLLT